MTNQKKLLISLLISDLARLEQACTDASLAREFAFGLKSSAAEKPVKYSTAFFVRP